MDTFRSRWIIQSRYLRRKNTAGVQETFGLNSSFATNWPVGHFGKVVVQYYAGWVEYLPPLFGGLAQLAHSGPAGDLQALNGARSFFFRPAQNGRFIGYTGV